ncbi:putative ATPase [Pseudomonas sp. URMO17WK12:I1]|nr:putative ATPase [Pseudomonas sp. URMO17WK12:I1]
MVVSGCSGGGKSTLLVELKKRGHRVIEEPGRRLIQAGGATPWDDLPAFLHQAMALAEQDYHAYASATDWVFCDRSLVDLASALQHLTASAYLAPLATTFRYHRQVFLTPPWPAIYCHDAERRHDLSAAIEEYERLLRDYPALGYQVQLVPLLDVASRADFLLEALYRDAEALSR